MLGGFFLGNLKALVFVMRNHWLEAEVLLAEISLHFMFIGLAILRILDMVRLMMNWNGVLRSRVGFLMLMMLTVVGMMVKPVLEVRRILIWMVDIATNMEADTLVFAIGITEAINMWLMDVMVLVHVHVVVLAVVWEVGGVLVMAVLSMRVVSVIEVWIIEVMVNKVWVVWLEFFLNCVNFVV